MQNPMICLLYLEINLLQRSISNTLSSKAPPWNLLYSCSIIALNSSSVISGFIYKPGCYNDIFRFARSSVAEGQIFWTFGFVFFKTDASIVTPETFPFPSLFKGFLPGFHIYYCACPFTNANAPDEFIATLAKMCGVMVIISTNRAYSLITHKPSSYCMRIGSNLICGLIVIPL